MVRCGVVWGGVGWGVAVVCSIVVRVVAVVCEYRCLFHVSSSFIVHRSTTDSRTNERTNKRTNERTNERMNERMNDCCYLRKRAA